jgi:hypothetical protein
MTALRLAAVPAIRFHVITLPEWNDLRSVTTVGAEYRSYDDAGVAVGNPSDPLLARTGSGYRLCFARRPALCVNEVRVAPRFAKAAA